MLRDDFVPAITPATVERFRSHVENLDATGNAPEAAADLAVMTELMAKDTLVIQEIPVYLSHFAELVGRMDRNISNLEDANQLPMSLLPWLLIGLGTAVTLLALVQLATLGPLEARGR